MPDPTETQAAFAELFTEIALQRLHPEPVPPQPVPPVDMAQALERIGEAMSVMYSGRRG